MLRINELSGFGGDAGYKANAVNFDGSTYLTKTTDLSGNADNKLLTVSFWVKTQTNTLNQTVYSATSGSLDQIIRLDTSNDTVELLFDNSSGTLILDASISHVIEDFGWFHILISLDLSDTGKRYAYINDASKSPTWNTYTNDTIDHTKTTHLISTTNSGAASNSVFGDVADLWIDWSYLDISTEANRRKFISAAGKPVDLGADGSKTTGVTPIMFFSGSTADWHTNKGDGGGFVENGTLTTASTTPSG